MVVENKEMTYSWKGKTAIVLGGAGFLGSRLVEQLTGAGALVVVADLDANWRGKGWPGVRATIDVDAGNFDDMTSLFQAYKPDVVFNLAAFVKGVLYNREHSLEMYHRNARALIPPAYAARKTGVPTFVQVSSVCVYGPKFQAAGCPEHQAFDQEPHPANAGYAWAKRAGELATYWMGDTRAVVARLANLYGPHDHFYPIEEAHVIPALIHKAFDSELATLPIYGTGKEVREFLYVEDAARGLMALAAYGRAGEAYNLSTNGRDKVSIERLGRLILEEAGADREIETLGGGGGDPERWVSSAKVERDTGWKAYITLAEGIRRTVGWYRTVAI